MAKKKSQKKQSKASKGNVTLGPKYQVNISSVSFKDPEVHGFLSDKQNKEEWLVKALVIGSIGLKNMLVGYNVDYVDKKFNQFMKEAEEKFKSEREEIQNKIDEVFSLDNKNSAISKLYQKIEETFDEDNKSSPMGKLITHLEEYFGDKKGIVRKIIEQTFDVSNKESPMGQFVENLNHYFNEENGVLRRIIDGTFDIDNKNTPLGSLMTNLELYFDKDRGILKKLLDNTFDMKNKESVMSQFVELLDDNFDVDKGNIKKLLDSNKKESPMGQLKSDLMEHILNIKNALITKEAKEEIIAKTALKGASFEDKVSIELDMMTSPYADSIQDTRTKTGRSGKAGDFVILINGDETRKVVVECKDTTYSIKRINEIFEDALKNRDAKFGIFLFKSQSQIPKAYQPLKITKNGVITSYDNHGLYFAYRICRLFIEKELEKIGAKIPVDKVEEEVHDLIEQCKLIDNILTRAKSISTSSDYIQKNLTALHTRIENGLAKIEGYVRI